MVASTELQFSIEVLCAFIFSILSLSLVSVVI